MSAHNTIADFLKAEHHLQEDLKKMQAAERLYSETPSEEHKADLQKNRDTVKKGWDKMNTIRVELKKADNTHHEVSGRVDELSKILTGLIKALEDRTYGYLTRSQDLPIPNYIYGRIISILENALKSDDKNVSSELHYSNDGTFDPATLLAIIKQMENEIRTCSFADFIEFYTWFRGYTNQIHNLWDKDNIQFGAAR